MKKINKKIFLLGATFVLPFSFTFAFSCSSNQDMPSQSQNVPVINNFQANINQNGNLLIVLEGLNLPSNENDFKNRVKLFVSKDNNNFSSPIDYANSIFTFKNNLIEVVFNNKKDLLNWYIKIEIDNSLTSKITKIASSVFIDENINKISLNPNVKIELDSSLPSNNINSFNDQSIIDLISKNVSIIFKNYPTAKKYDIKSLFDKREFSFSFEKNISKNTIKVSSLSFQILNPENNKIFIKKFQNINDFFEIVFSSQTIPNPTPPQQQLINASGGITNNGLNCDSFLEIINLFNWNKNLDFSTLNNNGLKSTLQNAGSKYQNVVLTLDNSGINKTNNSLLYLIISIPSQNINNQQITISGFNKKNNLDFQNNENIIINDFKLNFNLLLQDIVDPKTFAIQNNYSLLLKYLESITIRRQNSNITFDINKNNINEINFLSIEILENDNYLKLNIKDLNINLEGKEYINNNWENLLPIKLNSKNTSPLLVNLPTKNLVLTYIAAKKSQFYLDNLNSLSPSSVFAKIKEQNLAPLKILNEAEFKQAYFNNNTVFQFEPVINSTSINDFDGSMNLTFFLSALDNNNLSQPKIDSSAITIDVVGFAKIDQNILNKENNFLTLKDNTPSSNQLKQVLQNEINSFENENPQIGQKKKIAAPSIINSSFLPYNGNFYVENIDFDFNSKFTTWDSKFNLNLLGTVVRNNTVNNSSLFKLSNNLSILVKQIIMVIDKENIFLEKTNNGINLIIGLQIIYQFQNISKEIFSSISYKLK